MIINSCQLVSDYIWLSVIKDEPSSKELPKASVKFFLHATGNIAAKFLYDQVLASICLQCVHSLSLSVTPILLMHYVLFCIRY